MTTLAYYVETLYRLRCDRCFTAVTSPNKQGLVSTSERDGWQTTIDDQAVCPRCVKLKRMLADD